MHDSVHLRIINEDKTWSYTMPVQSETEVMNSGDLLVDGDVLTGTVKKPFIQDGKLMGAVLSFDGKAETALLHRKQMIGVDRNRRLANLKLGDKLMVKLIVSGEHPTRKTWASEAEIDNEVIVEHLICLLYTSRCV